MLHELGAYELSQLLRKREVSSVQIVEAFLERIDELESSIHAFLKVDPERALSEARKADELISEGKATSLLTGIPIAVKDNMCTNGVPTTCGSKMLETFVPPYDATVVARVKAASMPVLGKTNMDEFAMGSSTENSAFGVTRNPWDLSRVPGGSSGGSAACVASNEAPLSLGSDTGGSIRQPAGFCGVAGLKPTYGRVSRFGLVAFASSLDQIGPVAGSVRDCAMLLNLIAGHDPLDSTSLDADVPDYTGYLVGDVAGLRIGLPEEYFAAGLDESIKSCVLGSVRALEDAGAHVESISLPHTEYALATYYIIAPAEASSNLARYDGVRYGHRSEIAPDIVEMYSQTRREGFGPEVKRRIMLGTYGLSAGYYDAWYLKAQKVRTLIRRDFEAAYEKCDVIVGPTTPTGAFKIGEKTGDPLQMYLSDIYTVIANLGGIPAISVPCGYTAEGLPAGFQIMGRPLEEATVLKAAFAHEKLSGLRHLKPPSDIVPTGRGNQE